MVRNWVSWFQAHPGKLSRYTAPRLQLFSPFRDQKCRRFSSFSGNDRSFYPKLSRRLCTPLSCQTQVDGIYLDLKGTGGLKAIAASSHFGSRIGSTRLLTNFWPLHCRELVWVGAMLVQKGRAMDMHPECSNQLKETIPLRRRNASQSSRPYKSSNTFCKYSRQSHRLP